MMKDEELAALITELLDIQDDYINFDSLVLKDADRYKDMISIMTDFLRKKGI